MKLHLVTIALATLVISACASTPPTTAEQTPPLEAAPMANVTAPIDLSAQLQDMRKTSVFFDFDKSAIKPEYREVIQQQADFVKANSTVTVTLEGNADERGSNEYNLALGDRRANSVLKSLEVMGVPSGQIKTVSYGKEKPRLSCHEEKCWKENRRVDFMGKQGS